MFNDLFMPTIVQTLQDASNTYSLNWTVVAQSSPNRKEWDTLPMVIVCPSQKTQVYYKAFGITNTVSGYDVYLVNSGNLDSTNYNTSSQLFDVIMSEFMPQNAAMYTAGAWQTRVRPQFDFDRLSFPKGYSVSCVELNVYWINNPGI